MKYSGAGGGRQFRGSSELGLDCVHELAVLLEGQLRDLCTCNKVQQLGVEIRTHVTSRRDEAPYL